MSLPVISVENLSKSYRLGQIGTGTLTNDMKIRWARVRGKPNPMLKIGQEDRGSRNGGMIWALKDVGFSVEQGEVVGIIGRNGAGKSTLLKILSRVTAPTSGTIRIRGRVASLLEVGTGFHPELTGRENIFLNGAIMGMNRREIDRKFDEIVDFADVRTFIDTPVKRYSSGMHVRLAFSVAAHLEPEILVVDEVLAVGDAEFQKKCLGKMGDVAKGGRTILFVSHNLAAVSALCARGLLFRAGSVVSDGKIDDVIQVYQNSQRREDSDSLKDRKERRGNGVFRFSRYSVTGPEGRLLSGKPVRISIEIESEKKSIKRPDVAIIFRDLSGAILFTCFTAQQGAKIENLSPRATVSCDIPSFPLIPGRYRFDLWGSALGEEADYLRDAGDIVVDEADFFGTGKMPVERKHGSFLVHHQWAWRDGSVR